MPTSTDRPNRPWRLRQRALPQRSIVARTAAACTMVSASTKMSVLPVAARRRIPGTGNVSELNPNHARAIRAAMRGAVGRVVVDDD